MNSAASGPRACFAALGIAPTNDVRSIKRAYAGVLKTIDLAADPGRFARLRADYEAALAQAPHVTGASAPAALPISPDAGGTPAPVQEPAPAAAPPPAGWRLTDTSPRYRLKNPRKPLVDIDNGAGWTSATPAARMPPVLSRARGGISRVANFGGDDDGEGQAIAVLLDDTTRDRPRLLDAGLRRYGWDMVGTDLGVWGRDRDWLTRLLEERARWQAVAPRRLKKPEALLLRIAAAPPNGSVGDLYRWRMFAETLQSFPIWTAFVAGAYRLDEWNAAATQAPAWKRWAARSRQHPLPVLFVTWLLLTILGSMVSNKMGPEAAFALIAVFGVIQLVLLVLMAAAIGTAIGRRMRPKL